MVIPQLALPPRNAVQHEGEVGVLTLPQTQRTVVQVYSTQTMSCLALFLVAHRSCFPKSTNKPSPKPDSLFQTGSFLVSFVFVSCSPSMNQSMDKNLKQPHGRVLTATQPQARIALFCALSSPELTLKHRHPLTSATTHSSPPIISTESFLACDFFACQSLPDSTGSPTVKFLPRFYRFYVVCMGCGPLLIPEFTPGRSAPTTLSLSTRSSKYRPLTLLPLRPSGPKWSGTARYAQLSGAEWSLTRDGVSTWRRMVLN